MLKWFRDYIHDDLSASAIDKRLTKFIDEMEIQDNSRLKTTIGNFEKIRAAFVKKFEDDQNCNNPITILLDVMNEYLTGVEDEGGNIFLDFYIGAIEPEKLTGEKYWMRFLTTLLMPIIGIIIIIVSHFVTMVVTPYAAYNKYGGLLDIIPMILVTYFNMVAQPLMAFIYICFGACGTRNNSNQCPYDTGTYQFTRNMKLYTPLILKISAAFLISVLGTTLTNGGVWWGAFISLIVPATFLYYIFKFLICSFYEKRGVLYGLHVVLSLFFMFWFITRLWSSFAD